MGGKSERIHWVRRLSSTVTPTLEEERDLYTLANNVSNNVIAVEIVKKDDGSPSERHYNYPPIALKEALANSIYHKGYDQREPVEVRVSPDRIEILSHPGADRSISIEGLKNYRLTCRRYRNRRVGEFLKELGLTEGRNTGVHKILRALAPSWAGRVARRARRWNILVTFTLWPAASLAAECSSHGLAGAAAALIEIASGGGSKSLGL